MSFLVQNKIDDEVILCENPYKANLELGKVIFYVDPSALEKQLKEKYNILKKYSGFENDYFIVLGEIVEGSYRERKLKKLSERSYYNVRNGQVLNLTTLTGRWILKWKND